MMPIAFEIEIEGLQARRDVRTGAYELTGAGVTLRLREWTWGERRRLVEACVDREGRLDARAFVDELLELVGDGAVPEDARVVFGWAALQALGVRGGERPLSIAHAELLLARELGWTPVALDNQPAGAIDRLVAQLAPPPSPTTAPPGWTRILVEDD